ncbi:MAG: T9SS type A sorting domain-containing protein, partial [Ignavibacteriaceae bacterium]|nr:T9SS type A sorting domain-containing protein [Ignavibacteriaceae bacterium]
IYRKWESTGFDLIGTVTNQEFAFVDNEVEILVPNGEFPKNAKYYVIAAFEEDNSEPSNEIEYYVDKAGKISAAPEKIFTFNLMQNYPNPFNSVTKIKYSIAKPSLVTLKVYDILGREVKTLVNEYKTNGSYEVLFDASRLASGMYIYKLTAGSFTSVKKMQLLK